MATQKDPDLNNHKTENKSDQSNKIFCSNISKIAATII